jgi:acetyltransferase
MNSAAPITPCVATTSWPLGLDHSITVRPIRPEDADIEIEFARHLSLQSRYNRFLSGGVALTPELLDKFTRVDFTRDMALVATVTLGGEETLIGVARYVRLADDETGEFAIVIADAWQGLGIGKRLLARLIDCARSSGIRNLYGDLLAGNDAMLNLARAHGFRHEHHADPYLRRVTLEFGQRR